MDILQRGRDVLQAESRAIAALAGRLDARFVQAVQALLDCRGRVVTTGVGKAGAIARKLAATLSSTGTPAFFLHPAEAVHGDLGMITGDDVVIMLSYSGESDEVVRLIPSFRRLGGTMIALAGTTTSTLGQSADIVLDVSVDAEACPLGLAPTTSTTVMLAVGDALALAAMEARGFTQEEFAANHPAGALGRRLTLRVSDVLRSDDMLAIVEPYAKLRDALFAITRAGAGAACVVDEDGKLTGMITDGDIRRAVLRDVLSLERPSAEIMNSSPFVITGDPLAVEALKTLEEWPVKIGEAPVVDSDGRPVGMLMLKDLVRAGIV